MMRTCGDKRGSLDNALAFCSQASGSVTDDSGELRGCGAYASRVYGHGKVLSRSWRVSNPLAGVAGPSPPPQAVRAVSSSCPNNGEGRSMFPLSIRTAASIHCDETAKGTENSEQATTVGCLRGASLNPGSGRVRSSAEAKAPPPSTPSRHATSMATSHLLPHPPVPPPPLQCVRKYPEGKSKRDRRAAQQRREEESAGRGNAISSSFDITTSRSSDASAPHASSVRLSPTRQLSLGTAFSPANEGSWRPGLGERASGVGIQSLDGMDGSLDSFEGYGSGFVMDSSTEAVEVTRAFASTHTREVKLKTSATFGTSKDRVALLWRSARHSQTSEHRTKVMVTLPATRSASDRPPASSSPGRVASPLSPPPSGQQQHGWTQGRRSTLWYAPPAPQSPLEEIMPHLEAGNVPGVVVDDDRAVLEQRLHLLRLFQRSPQEEAAWRFARRVRYTAVIYHLFLLFFSGVSVTAVYLYLERNNQILGIAELGNPIPRPHIALNVVLWCYGGLSLWFLLSFPLLYEGRCMYLKRQREKTILAGKAIAAEPVSAAAESLASEPTPLPPLPQPARVAREASVKKRSWSSLLSMRGLWRICRGRNGSARLPSLPSMIVSLGSEEDTEVENPLRRGPPQGSPTSSFHIHRTSSSAEVVASPKRRCEGSDVDSVAAAPATTVPVNAAEAHPSAVLAPRKRSAETVMLMWATSHTPTNRPAMATPQTPTGATSNRISGTARYAHAHSDKNGSKIDVASAARSGCHTGRHCSADQPSSHRLPPPPSLPCQVKFASQQPVRLPAPPTYSPSCHAKEAAGQKAESQAAEPTESPVPKCGGQTRYEIMEAAIRGVYPVLCMCAIIIGSSFCLLSLVNVYAAQTSAVQWSRKLELAYGGVPKEGVAHRISPSLNTMRDLRTGFISGSLKEMQWLCKDIQRNGRCSGFATPCIDDYPTPEDAYTAHCPYCTHDVQAEIRAVAGTRTCATHFRDVQCAYAITYSIVLVVGDLFLFTSLLLIFFSQTKRSWYPTDWDLV